MKKENVEKIEQLISDVEDDITAAGDSFKDDIDLALGDYYEKARKIKKEAFDKLGVLSDILHEDIHNAKQAFNEKLHRKADGMGCSWWIEEIKRQIRIYGGEK